MKPASPHHLLSAYLDGELTPAEREDVERLLEESPEARQELRELEQVGELLRQIPREALPGAFSAQVLDVCLSDTGQFESETLSGNVPDTVARKDAKPRRQTFGWARAVAATAAVAVMGWIVIANLPGPRRDTVPEVASKSNDLPAEESEELAKANGQRSLPMAPGGVDSLSLNEARLAQSSDEAKLADYAGQAADDAFAAKPGRGASLTGSPAQSRNLRTDQVAVVRVVVRDRQQGLARLREVLGKPHVFADPIEEKSFAGAASNVAVYVEADQALFNAALRNLENDAAVDRLSRGETVALAKIEPLLWPKQIQSGGAGRPQMSRFGGNRVRSVGNSGFAPANAPRTNAVPAKPEDKSLAEPAAKNATEPRPAPPASFTPQSESPKEGKPRKSDISPAGSGASIERIVGRKPAADAKVKRRAGDAEKPKPGETGAMFSKELTLPAPLLDELQNGAAPDATQEAEAGDREFVRPRSRNQRVQVLFVFFEEAGPKPAGVKPAPAKADLPK